MTTTSIADYTPPNRKAYLGDGLYAEFDGYQIEVYASDGMSKTNRVFFDRGTADAFVRFVKEVTNNG